MQVLHKPHQLSWLHFSPRERRNVGKHSRPITSTQRPNQLDGSPIISVRFNVFHSLVTSFSSVATSLIKVLQYSQSQSFDNLSKTKITALRTLEARLVDPQYRKSHIPNATILYTQTHVPCKLALSWYRSNHVEYIDQSDIGQVQ